MLSKLIWGARASLLVGILSTLFGLVGGMALGLLAGWFGKWVDFGAMRLVDLLLSVPSLLLAVSIAAIAGQSPMSVIVAIAVVQVPIFARLLRASMLAQRGQDYVLAASTLGLGRRSVTMSHVLPNSVGPVIVQATLTLATAVIEAAALSYLGLGGGEPYTAEWGRMLAYAQQELAVAPRLAILPGICITMTALGFTLVGEACARPWTRAPAPLTSRLGEHRASGGQTAMSSSLPGIDASRRRVYGSRGLVKISSEDAASTSSPVLHDADVVADEPHHGEVVRDEQVAQAVLALQVAQKRQHLVLDQHVERRDRLVAHDEVGRERERPRDRDALALTARQLGRIAAQHRLRQRDVVEQLPHARRALLGRSALVEVEGLGDDPLDREHRVQRRVRVLEDRLHALAELASDLALEARDILAVEADAIRSSARTPAASCAPWSSCPTRTRPRSRPSHRAGSRTTRPAPPRSPPCCRAP